MNSAETIVLEIELIMLMRTREVRLENASSLIRARDREIVEACKASVMGVYDGGGKIMDHIEALDSVLRDLDGGK